MIPLGVLASARVASGAPDPLAGIPFEWRFESSSITGLSDGATVAIWGDTSGNARNATQATEANKPTWTPAAFGGAGGVTVGRTQWLATGAVATVGQPTVFYFVGSFGTTYPAYAYDGLAGTTRQYALASSAIVFEMGAVEARYRGKQNNGTAAVRMIRYVGSAGTLNVNGGAGLIMSNNIGASGITGVTIGNVAAGTAGLGATIGALLVGTGHTVAQMNTVGAYLATTYGFSWTDVAS